MVTSLQVSSNISSHRVGSLFYGCGFGLGDGFLADGMFWRVVPGFGTGKSGKESLRASSLATTAERYFLNCRAVFSRVTTTSCEPSALDGKVRSSSSLSFASHIKMMKDSPRRSSKIGNTKPPIEPISYGHRKPNKTGSRFFSSNDIPTTFTASQN